ncbi:hypothetical protein [Mycobacterium intracellulare]|uniref:hypothetical protein n=1 Tax=Mycobacterium intracellulare TaxID=1767 RepID=UPI0013E0DE69|nr:hypothetical protein [Mycobacterium intracellulare]
MHHEHDCGCDQCFRASALGFVVLARRPNQPDEIVSAVFPAYPNGLEQAQNVLESCRAKEAKSADWLAENTFSDGTDIDDPVEYVIGQISEVETP